MKIAFILADKWFRASIDFDGLLKAIAEQGHETMLVCVENQAGEAEFPVLEASLKQQLDPQFWRDLKIDVGVVFTCLQRAALPKALRDAGVTVVSRADNDGLCGVRVNPLAAYRNSVQPAKGPRDLVRRAKHFVARYFKYYQCEAEEIIDHVDSSHAVCIETEYARKHLVRFLNHYGRGDLAERLYVVPHSVPDRYIQAEVSPGPRQPRVFCGGRWYDEQKNAELLARTITKVVAQQGDLQFVIAGKGSKEIFGDLAAQFPDRVLLPGVVPASEMLPLLNSCRFLLSSSRWESHPIGALEAVCSGCTVVATPIPGFLDIADGGRSGTIAESHRAEALARATLVENAKWESGERNPLQIAEHWRKIVNNRVVAGGMLQAALAGMGKSTANRDAQVI